MINVSISNISGGTPAEHSARIEALKEDLHNWTTKEMQDAVVSIYTDERCRYVIDQYMQVHNIH